MRDNCPFCEKALTKENSTQEHVLGKWIRKVDAVKHSWHKPPGAGQRRLLNGVEFSPELNRVAISSEVHDRKFEHPMYCTVEVCKDCNGVWMSQLELGVMPLLTPMMNDEPVTLSFSDMKLFARWATKTAVAFEQDHPESASISARQIRTLVQGMAPPTTHVHIARFDDVSDVMLRHTAIGFLEQTTQLQGKVSMSLFSRGHVVVLVRTISPSRMAPWTDALLPALDHRWTRVWPSTAANLDWKADTERVTRQDIEDLTDLHTTSTLDNASN